MATPATPTNLDAATIPHPDPPDVQWASHFWDVYKYRHETWYRTFYRSMWIIGVLMATPWIPWIKDNYHVLRNTWVRLGYGAATFIFFVLVMYFLAIQFQDQERAKRELDLSSGVTPQPVPQWAAFTREGTRRKTGIFIGFGVVVLTAWICSLLWLWSRNPLVN